MLYKFLYQLQVKFRNFSVFKWKPIHARWAQRTTLHQYNHDLEQRHISLGLLKLRRIQTLFSVCLFSLQFFTPRILRHLKQNNIPSFYLQNIYSVLYPKTIYIHHLSFKVLWNFKLPHHPFSWALWFQFPQFSTLDAELHTPCPGKNAAYVLARRHLLIYGMLSNACFWASVKDS